MLNSELVKNQIKETPLITQEFFQYSSGREIKLGDKLCLAFFEDKHSDTEMSVKLLKFHPEEYGTLYEDAHEFTRSDNFPTLKYKNETKD